MKNMRRVTVDEAEIEDADCEGVYFFFFKKGLELLERGSFFEFGSSPPIAMGQAPLCYIGSSLNMQKRMRAHLRGDSRQSNLRITIASIIGGDLNLKGWSTGLAKSCHFGASGEQALTKWFVEHSIVHVMPTTHSRDLEKQFIKVLAPPFNISAQRCDGYAKHLMSLRSRYGYFADLPCQGLRSRTLH